MKIFLITVLVTYLIIFVYKTKSGSPSIWSRDSHLKLLRKYIKPGMRVADLGAGDARVLLAMIDQGAQYAEGYEIEPLVWLVGNYQIYKRNMGGKAVLKFADMWSADLAEFDLVYIYQLTRYAPRFVEKCKKEMRKGSLVIANTYPLEGLRLIAKDKDLMVYML